MPTPRPSQWQSTLAGAFHIPFAQAHTINPEKAKAYFAYCRTVEGRLEGFLNKEANRRAWEQAKEWLRGGD